MTQVLVPRRYRPVLERLEDRLPPGSALDWLLFPLLAQSLLPSTPEAIAPLRTETSTATLDRQAAPSSHGLRLLGDRAIESVYSTEAGAAARPAAPTTLIEFSAPVFTAIGDTLGQLTEAANRVAIPRRDGHEEPRPAFVGDMSHQDIPRGGRAPAGGPAFVLPHAADITGVAGLGGDGSILSGPGGDQELIPVGSEWRYLDDGSDQGAAWRELTYDDSGWASGYAQLGYGDGDEGTEVGFGPDPDNKYITTYFRHTFTVDDPSVFPTLHTFLLRDDGAVVYLNGTEIYRSNMPAGGINYLTPASVAVGGDDESAWHHSALPSAGILFAGPNVLAVEVHQANPTSSDISFDFDLIGTVAVRFAVIGDYGVDTQAERDVADLVNSWYSDFVVTVGDNNYPTGSASTIVQNIGQYYCPFIGNPDAPASQRCDSGLSFNRFFPTPGNHDWDSSSPLQPYLNYFTLPTDSGNERYYQTGWGPVQFFGVDSDPREPDGRTSGSTQGQWFQNQLAASTAPWKLVLMHHPPYSSGSHGNTPQMQWPYQAWGASAVLAGHDHTYERIIRDDFPYFVNGLGGQSRYGFGPPVQGSEARFADDWGAMYVEATSWYIYFAFVNVGGWYYDGHVLYQ